MSLTFHANGLITGSKITMPEGSGCKGAVIQRVKVERGGNTGTSDVSRNSDGGWDDVNTISFTPFYSNSIINMHMNYSVGSQNNVKFYFRYAYDNGNGSDGVEWTPLIAAAYGEHFQIVKYLIEQGEADPNIATSDGYNVLHCAADNNRTSTELIELLLTNMTLDSINKKNRWGDTPLDRAYAYNYNPIRQEIIALLRSKGGKANRYDVNGRYVGEGNGDLND